MQARNRGICQRKNISSITAQKPVLNLSLHAISSQEIKDHLRTQFVNLLCWKLCCWTNKLQELHWKHLLLNNQEENSVSTRHYCHWQRHGDRRGTTVVNRRRKSAVGQSAGGTGIDPEVLYKVAWYASRRPLRCHLLQQSATLIYPPVL